MLPKSLRLLKGQVFIELLIAMAVMAILGLTLFRLATISYELISFSRARIAARHLAQEKIEFIRNLPYDEVGTSGGIPSGGLAQSENIVRNGLSYTVRVAVVYIDDPFDGVVPDDLLPTDYKRVRVDVSWQGIASSSINPVTMISDISPKGIETAAGGGTLSVLVFDANATPLTQADVTIVASSVTPAVNLSLKTAASGRVILPGAPPCNGCYEITATKSGYSSDRTYSIAEIANPNKPHASVIEGQLTEISFAIDRVGTINFTSRSSRQNGFAPLPDITFRLKGEKTLGTDVNDEPVYKYEQAHTTGAAGTLSLTNLEWDNYEIFMPTGSSYDISGTNPLTPYSLLPGATVDFNFALDTDTADSLLAVFKDPSSAPIATVAARLSDGAGFEATGSSGISGDPDFGQLFFPSLSAQTYTLEATASGYLDFSGSIIVLNQSKEQVILTPQ
ncbi:MAG: hypothetical protein UX19_C0002G0055 [Candidatus Woesebacteria bacterium GW2011_GWA1_45_8]|uniref:Carboxypeptidase regulatory-like domain-containing protein n=1 Tax=Candidatus Woesebacteria bacterium GW2011_GWA1_45_8 TaxID=1618559 RepID=A0A0G1Q3T5_9BACT|nr:MAG: hypothetical protein UX19_C0002G0055 [Candidatus Woesebacteria bacterium GW2011_GWA1_45_8]